MLRWPRQVTQKGLGAGSGGDGTRGAGKDGVLEVLLTLYPIPYTLFACFAM